MRCFWETTLSGEILDDMTSRCSGAEIIAPRAPSFVPPAASLFEPVSDRYGFRLALVFGNHAKGGLCPYVAANKCFHCDIGSGEGAAFDNLTNRRRLAFFRDHYQPILESINHLVLYNSGSVLNPYEMPVELLDEILAFARSLPALRVISFDSREAFIKPATLRHILHCLDDSHAVHPILGLETADDRIRNKLLEKAMPRSAIVRAFRAISQVASDCGRQRLGVDINIVIGAPGTTEKSAIDDAVSTARFALGLGLEHGVKVDLNLHPYYAGQRGTARFPGQMRCTFKLAVSAIARIAEFAQSMAAETNLFVGWQDEGHDLSRDDRQREIACMKSAFDHFNRMNDPAVFGR
jgi:hypothetical protein